MANLFYCSYIVLLFIPEEFKLLFTFHFKVLFLLLIIFHVPALVAPDFVQGKTRIAAFGPTTAQAVRDMELILDIEAPMPNAPSMTGALELFIKKANNL